VTGGAGGPDSKCDVDDELPLGWLAMKSTAQLRKERGVPLPKKQDSEYKVGRLLVPAAALNRSV
jgi:hypothetical protein